MLFWNKDEEGHIWVILGKRTIHHGPGYQQWSISGGGHEHYDDSLKETAIREAREEIDMEVHGPASVGFLCSLRLPFIFRFDVFEHERKEKIPIKWFCEEFSDVRWFRADQLPRDAMLLTRIEVHSLLKKLKHVGA
ncbi:MAG: NUDIX hydrolase [Sphaerochaetaceae bacterium]|nr:NUDIX hydrolase [Spirochaetales bacterium]MDY5500218.1 NUDIX hydrolase [Sphaerochaetaceae bacterium]